MLEMDACRAPARGETAKTSEIMASLRGAAGESWNDDDESLLQQSSE
jgi:hypothetical protein